MSNQRRRRPAPRSLLCGRFAARAGCRRADVSRAQPTPVIMKRGDHLPTRVLDGAPGRQQVRRGRATRPASSNRRKYSPEPGTRRGAPIVAAVPERIQEHYIGRGERVSGRATLAPAGMTPPGRSPGKWPGKWAREVAGEVAREVARGSGPGGRRGSGPGGRRGSGPGGGRGGRPGGRAGKWPGRSPGMAEVRLRRGRSWLVRVTRARMTPC